jgi:hypothetical protein
MILEMRDRCMWCTSVSWTWGWTPRPGRPRPCPPGPPPVAVGQQGVHPRWCRTGRAAWAASRASPSSEGCRDISRCGGRLWQLVIVL